MATRGGIATFVWDMQDTDLWRDWHIHHVATHRNGSIPARIAVFLEALPKALYEMVRYRPDIVHIHTSSRGSFVRKFVIAWMAYAFRLPVVIHVHGSKFDVFYDSSPRLGKALIRETFERADAVIALGQTWTSRLRRIAPRARIESIAAAVRLGNPVDHLTSEPVRVVFLGQIGERKGTFVLLNAWAELVRSSDSGAKLTVAGDGQVDRARALVDELGIGDTVDILSWVSMEEVNKLLATAHVLVLPSQNEGTPRAVLEAMANGLCVVASDVGGIPELVADTGVLVKPDDVTGLAKALTKVLDDPGERAVLGARAFGRVQQEYDLDLVARRFDSLYRDILESRSRPVAAAPLR